MKNLVVYFLFAFIILGAANCSSKQEGDDLVLGKVKGKSITVGDFRKTLVEEYGFKDEKLTPDNVKTIFREYYSVYAFVKEGEEKGFFKTENVLKEEEQNKRELMKQYMSQLLWEREIKPQLVISEDEYLPFQKSIKVRHILVMFEKRSKKEALAQIEKIKKDLTVQNFAEMANKYSEDPGNQGSGGDLGWVDSSTAFVENFKKAMLAAKKGEIVGPVETEYGYHLIWIEDEKMKSLEEVKADKKITENLMKNKSIGISQKYMEDLRNKYKNKIQYYPEKLKDVKKFEKDNFYSVEGAGSITVGQIAQMMGPSIKQYIANPEQLRSIIQREFIDRDIRYLEGLAKGYDKDKDILKRIEFELFRLRANLYENQLRAQIRSKPEISTVDEEELKAHYEANKVQFTKKEKDKETVLPFSQVKDWIKEEIILNREQEQINKVKQELFRKYQIEFGI